MHFYRKVLICDYAPENGLYRNICSAKLLIIINTIINQESFY